ncbi:hypothetical protein GYH30_011954 [Glycine max]|nr:hypothetical protein GYH30_011954 [Glycine max]
MSPPLSFFTGATAASILGLYALHKGLSHLPIIHNNTS